MAKKKKIYNRLPGKKRKFFGYDTLWLGPDHLLSIDSRIFSEDYKRFYYKDIQAIITYKLNHWKIINIILGSLSAILLLMAFFNEGVISILFSVLGGLFFLFFVIYLLRGSNCACHIKTAVQTERLPSLYRLRKARKAIGLLRSRIENVQGRLTSEAIKEGIPRILQEKPQPYRLRPSAPPLTDEKGHWHEVLFYLLLSSGLFCIIDIFYNHITLIFIGSVFFAVIIIVVIISLVKQQNSNITSALRKLTWVSLAWVCINFAIGNIIYFTVFINNIENPEIIHNQLKIMTTLSKISPFDSLFLMGAYIFSALSALILGFFGLFLFKRFQATSTETPSTQEDTHLQRNEQWRI
ncbi:MAG: hypothetical protein SWO11_05285 [Thermodesulfobacteriota bacterium]|nr:hypothetical protein [Thermodesulfobacteriota bacterium]